MRIIQMQTHTAAALFSVACGVFAILMLVPLSLHAQMGSGDVLGTVTDATGAVVPGAGVTIVNAGTSAERKTATNNNGEYVFTTLPNGTYSITVQAKGFKTYTIAGFPLSTGDRARYDVKLETGAVTEKVEVHGVVAALQTDSSEVTSTIYSQAVQDLPLNNRLFVAALRIQPGITAGNQGGATAGGNGTPYDRRPDSTIVANDQNPALNNQMIDGFDNNERVIGSIGLQPSIDGIQEVKVDTSSYRAENGRTGGAVVNVITKSGTNEFHGSAYDYFRNDIFDSDSYNFTSGTSVIKPEYRQNNFGGSVGGPIRIPKLYNGKDKTFFFFDIEEDRVIKGQTYQTTVPTAFQVANPGNLTDAGGPNLNSNTKGYTNCTDASGNTLVGSNPFITSTATCALSPMFMSLFQLFPASQVDTNGVGYRTDSPRLTQYGRTWDLRVDQHFNGNNMLFARYASNPIQSVVPAAWPTITSGPYAGINPGSGGAGSGLIGPSTTYSQNFQVDYVHIFNSTLLMDLKAGYTRVNTQSHPFDFGIGAAAKLGIPGVYVPGLPQTDSLPVVGGPGLPWLGVGGENENYEAIDNTYQYSGAVTYTHGPHTFKVGGGVNRRQVAPNEDAYAGGFILGLATPPFNMYQADFETGYMFGMFRGVQMDLPHFEAWEPYGYAQDDWRVTLKLTLNLGLRYDVFTPFTEINGKYANYIPSTESFILGTQSPTVGVATDYHDFGPRFGFAYSFTPKTVLRGGFGMSYYPPDIGDVSANGAEVAVMQNPNPPYLFNYINIGPQVTNFFTTPITAVESPSLIDMSTWQSNPNVTAVLSKSKGLSSSYMESFNLMLQKEIGANTLSLGWVGIMGRQLMRSINLQNPGPPGANNPPLPNVYTNLPNIQDIQYQYNGNTAGYNAMQLVYARRLTSGLVLNANYTWAHGLDDTAAGALSPGPIDPANSHADYGNSQQDIRQRVAVNGSYALPFAKGSHGIEAVLLKDWQATSIYYWQTGLPFSVTSRASAPNGQLYTEELGLNSDYPDVVGNVNAVPGGRSLNEWFNVQAFRPQTLGTIGNERPMQFRGPRDRRGDLAISKIFPLAESFKLQFRAECFNISNTPNFNIGTNSTIGGWLTNASGEVTGVNTAGSTLGLITDTAANENPREFQFALKLQF